MRRPRALMMIALLAAVLLAGSCSVPTDESAQGIDPEELPDVLRSTSTTTTSTLPPPLAKTVTVYFLSNPDDGDQPVVVAREREVAAGSGVADALVTLFGSGLTTVTEEEQEAGLFNSLADEFSLNGVRVDDDIATIDISHIDTVTGEPDDAPIGTVLRNVAAQLVWSAIEDDDIEAVLIERDGEPLSLPTQTAEGDSESDEPVDRGDFARYDSTNPPPTITAANTTSTTTPPSTTSPSTTTPA